MFHWSLLFRISLYSWIAMETWVWARDRHRRSGTSGDRGSLLAVVAAYVLAMIAAWHFANFQRWAAIQPFSPTVFVTGLVLVWAGMAFRLWAVLVLGRFFRITVLVQDEHRLVEAGPYRLLQHPAYSGSLLTLIGLGLAMGNWLSLAAMVLVPLAAYAYRIRVEEQALKARFGESYDRYAATRWRLVPFLI
jgi:protein-S-isoprenylcysteine O-methyltransferase Ste14